MIDTSIALEALICFLLASVLLRDLFREEPINSRLLHIFITEHEKRVIQTINQTEETLIRNTQAQLREIVSAIDEINIKLDKNERRN